MAKKNLLNAEGLASVWSQNPAPASKKVAQKKSVKNDPEEKKVTASVPAPPEKEVQKKPKSTPSRKPASRKKANVGSGTQTISVSLEDLKKEKPQFTSYRIRKDLYHKLKAIAQEQGIKQTGKMIERILESFCEHHEQQNG